MVTDYFLIGYIAVLNLERIEIREPYLTSTIECLLNGLRNEEDLDEVHAKLLEAARDIERLIPLLRYYLAQEEPRDELAKNRFWLERERINRDLEESLRNFSMINIVLETSQTA
uniref:Uncharacterized protein n=1 Tax=Romanomermis culicivorax TaxID=13658 RepID=A0A915K417_ROMCU